MVAKVRKFLQKAKKKSRNYFKRRVLNIIYTENAAKSS